jgi:hypothetical protein
MKYSIDVGITTHRIQSIYIRHRAAFITTIYSDNKTLTIPREIIIDSE